MKSRDDAQDLGHALPRLQHRDAADRKVGVVGDAIAGFGEARVALAGGEAAAHGLHLDRQIDQVLDRLVVLHQPHRVGQSERQAQRELGF